MVAPHEGRSNADERLSIRVINAIAEHEGTTPTEIRPVLYDIIDPDALDSLFSATYRGETRANGNVEFQYGPHKVTVHSDGRIEIEHVRDSQPFSSASETASGDN
ncbi:HalOD1 output domain-containing protein [Haladaptatus sp. CMAA 1911]|uniref:HalOD1 output domain-containing protein n=1 Tax=unclassified Haladaptatus TaxID=2622732 RepID=UPI0037544E56